MTEFNDELSIRAERFGRTEDREDWTFICRHPDLVKRTKRIVSVINKELSCHEDSDLVQIAFSEILRDLAGSYDRTKSKFEDYFCYLLALRLQPHINQTLPITDVRLIDGVKQITYAQRANPIIGEDGSEIDPVDLVPHDASGPPEQAHALSLLEKIDPDEAALLHLRHNEGKTNDEIATLTGINRKKVGALIDGIEVAFKEKYVSAAAL
jgi:RNA polymerase sigma factor (sigma-70 family)